MWDIDISSCENSCQAHRKSCILFSNLSIYHIMLTAGKALN